MLSPCICLLSKDPQLRTDLSIIYANRSAALDALGLYAGVVQDADTALSLGYPRNLQFKVGPDVVVAAAAKTCPIGL